LDGSPPGVSAGPETEAELLDLARALIARDAVVSATAREITRHIALGRDPLGDAFCRIRPPRQRRDLGATYTPSGIIAAMLDWVAQIAGSRPVARIVDPGTGSGRFLLAAARRFPEAVLVGVELDPAAALLLRANLAVAGLTARCEVRIADYRQTDLPRIDGVTVFLGNPPYLRHHGIAPEWKDWYARTARERGITASRLAGLHLHFFFRTAALMQAGDIGCFVTAAEWLDVNYGAPLRQLLAGPLGLATLQVLDPKALPFSDAVTTSVITGFRPGTDAASVSVRAVPNVDDLGDLTRGRELARATLAAAPRWSPLLRPARTLPAGWNELGALCRVHRGQVTGDNGFWIAGPHSAGLPPEFLFAGITKARELLGAERLDSTSSLRRVIDLPADLDALDAEPRAIVEQFLALARDRRADRSYIARHRRPWWRVGLRAPAPILCTYMARRPPAFVRNICAARHINIAHGLYPRGAMTGIELDALVAFLRANVAQDQGRTYAGGLTKFEPKELERVPVPPLAEMIEML
jgi:hypothetical protein